MTEFKVGDIVELLPDRPDCISEKTWSESYIWRKDLTGKKEITKVEHGTYYMPDGTQTDLLSLKGISIRCYAHIFFRLADSALRQDSTEDGYLTTSEGFKTKKENWSKGLNLL